jgi:hypothetical protein
MISTQDLTGLPAVDQLKDLLQSLAVLDAVICPEWEGRYYSFDARWSRSEQMGSMRTGSGDGFFALFTADGCFLKGFAHKSPMSPHVRQPPTVWPGVLEGVPPEWNSALKEPAFMMEDTTFCVWRGRDEDAWHHGPVDFPAGEDPDGSASLLRLLTGEPHDYARWAEEYYERPIPIETVEHVYRHEPLTEQVVRALNRRLKLRDLAAVVKDIGYA